MSVIAKIVGVPSLWLFSLMLLCQSRSFQENHEIPKSEQPWLNTLDNYEKKGFYSNALAFCDSLEAKFRDQEEWENWVKIRYRKLVLSDIYSEMNWSIQAKISYAKETLMFSKLFLNDTSSILGLPLERIGVNFLTINLDSASYYLSLAAKNLSNSAEPVAMINVIRAQGYIHYSQKNHQEAILFYDSARSLAISFDNSPNFLISQIERTLGTLYNFYGDQDAAIAFTREGVDRMLFSEKVLTADDSSTLADYYINLGLFFADKGDYSRATDEIEEGIALLGKLNNDYAMVKARALNSLGSVYLQFKYNSIANQALQQAWFHAENNMVNQSDKKTGAQICTSLSQYYRLEGDYLQANRFLTIAQNLQKEYARDIFSLDLERANLAFDLDQYALTVSELNRIENLIDKGISIPVELQIQVFDLLGEVSLVNHDTIAAISNFNKSLDLCGFISDKDSVSHALIFPNRAYPILLKLIKLYYERDDATALIELLDVINEVFTLQRQEYLAPESKRELQKVIRQIFEIGIDVCLEQYNLSKDDTHLVRCWYLLEKSKQNVLLDASQQKQARQMGGVPVEIIEAEKELSQRLSYYQKVNLVAIKSQDAVKENTSRDYIIRIKNQIDSLNEFISKNHPIYDNLRKIQEPESINTVRSLLDSQTHLVSFLLGKDAVFGCALSQDGLVVKKLNIHPDSVFVISNLLVNSLVNYENPELLNVYCKTAFSFFEELIRPLFSFALPQNLIILPDSYLTNLPWEIVLTKEVSFSESIPDYRHLPYLLKKTNVTYAPSATWLKQVQVLSQNTISEREGEALGFAPVYGSRYSKLRSSYSSVARDSALQKLSASLDELHFLEEHIAGQYFSRNEATWDRFTQEAEAYSIIHLALHGQASFEHPLGGRLAFADSVPGAWQWIDGFELTNQPLTADLVVLSACETGTGAYQEGEGIMSMARIFQAAGAERVVNSLWPANDKATAEIMKSFYQHLTDGKPFEEALGQAKRDYLQYADPSEVHPFYWAAFVGQGPSGMIEVKPARNDQWLYLLSLGVLLAGVVGWYFARRR
ncbi:MAG TPA: hypothetical protein DCP28_19090 [Cytophagales bacterium]|nr:hypothetical protein [Cytophagales bacterium]